MIDEPDDEYDLYYGLGVLALGADFELAGHAHPLGQRLGAHLAFPRRQGMAALPQARNGRGIPAPGTIRLPRDRD
jgi:hypothetical protein